MKILDARTVPPAVRHATIFQTFDDLAAGDHFVLVNGHYPKPLLMQFIAERPGQFEWNVLEAGPELHRVGIEKRSAPGPRGVGEYMQTDHMRLDAIVQRLATALDAGDAAAARAPFDEFACGLERHMRAEEDVLFPTFEQATGMVGGPVRVMHLEHAELRERLAHIAAALDASDAAQAGAVLAEVVEVLSAHNVKEENIIYPRTDHALGETESDALVQRMLSL